MISFKSLLANLAKRARGLKGPVAAIPQDRHPLSARPDGSGEKKSALYYILDYIVRTDTIPGSQALRIIKMIDNCDFSEF